MVFGWGFHGLLATGPRSYQNIWSLPCHCAFKDLQIRILSHIFSFLSWHSHLLNRYRCVHCCNLFLPFPSLIPHTHLLLIPGLPVPWLFLFWQFLNLHLLRASQRRAHILHVSTEKCFPSACPGYTRPTCASGSCGAPGTCLDISHRVRLIQPHYGPAIWVLQILFHWAGNELSRFPYMKNRIKLTAGKQLAHGKVWRWRVC